MTQTTLNDNSKKISFDNFDFTKKKIRISSPVSLLACKFMGVKLDDLTYLSYDDFLQENPDYKSLEPNIAIERYEHYVDRRQKLISSLKKIRNEIIKEKKDSNASASFISNNLTSNYYNMFKNKISKNNSVNNFNKTFNIMKNISLKKSASMNKFLEKNKSLMILDNENKLKKEKKRQLINIKREIDYRLIKEQERIKNFEKMRKKSENLRMIKTKKLDELSLKKFINDKKEKEKKIKMENFRKKLEEKQQEKIMKETKKFLNEQKKRKDEEKQRKIKFQFQEKIEKEIRDKVLEKNLMHHKELLERQNKIEEIKRKREILFEQKKEELSKLNEAKQKMDKMKLNNVLEEKEKLLEEKITLYNLKQKKFEELQKRKEKEKKDEQIKQLFNKQRKLLNIKKVLQKNKSMEESKIKKYQQRIKQQEQNQILRHQKELKSLEKKNKENEIKEIKFKEKKEINKNNIEKRKNLIMKKIDMEEERIKKQKLKQEKEMMEKYNILYMQREDRKKQIEQNERIQQYQRELKLEEINLRMEKIEQIQNQRIFLEEKRKQKEKELSDEKIGMINRLNKIMNSENEINLTRDEILNYVIKDVKPNINNVGSKTPIIRRTIALETKFNNKSNLSNSNSKKYDIDIDKSKLIENKSRENQYFNDSQVLKDNFNHNSEDMGDSLEKK